MWILTKELKTADEYTIIMLGTYFSDIIFKILLQNPIGDLLFYYAFPLYAIMSARLCISRDRY